MSTFDISERQAEILRELGTVQMTARQISHAIGVASDDMSSINHAYTRNWRLTHKIVLPRLRGLWRRGFVRSDAAGWWNLSLSHWERTDAGRTALMLHDARR